MRQNIEQVGIWDSRMTAVRKASLTYALTADVILNKLYPSVLVFDLNGTDRNLYLPALSEERQYAIANVSSVGNLTVRNSGGVAQVVMPPGYLYMFFATPSRWIWMGSFAGTADPTGTTEDLRQITAAGAVNISATEAGIAINKAVASVTPVTLPAVASRNGKPVRIVDWAGNVDVANPIQITPNGTEKIMNRAAWEVSNGGIVLYPSVSLNGWTIE